MQLELQELLANKAFDELNAVERSFVLEQLSEEEYRAQHHVVVESRTLFQSEASGLVPLPPTAALASLKKKQFDPIPSVTKSAPKPQLWHYPVPLWQAAAACLFFVFSYGLLAYDSTEKEATGEIATVIRDTIFVDKIKEVFRPADTIVKVIYDTLYIEKTVEEPVYAALADSAVRREEVVMEAVRFDQSMDSYTANTGQPMSKDTFLQLFSRVVTY